VLNTEEGAYRWLDSLDRYGFACVNGVEPTTAATEKVCARAGVIKHTVFGGMWEFTANMEHNEYVRVPLWSV